MSGVADVTRRWIGDGRMREQRCQVWGMRLGHGNSGIRGGRGTTTAWAQVVVELGWRGARETMAWARARTEGPGEERRREEKKRRERKEKKRNFAKKFKFYRI